MHFHMTPVCTDIYRGLQGIWVVWNSQTLKLVFDFCFKNTQEHNIIVWTPLQIDTSQVTL